VRFRALREFGWERILILAKSVGAMGVAFYPVWWIHVHVLAGRLPTLPLSLAVSFLGVQILIILMQVSASAAVKKLDAWERQHATQFRAVVQRVLAAHLSGKDRSKELARLRRKRPVNFDRSVAALLATLTGSERDRLSELAEKFGVIRRWQRLARRGRLEYKTALEWMAALSPHMAGSALQPVMHNTLLAQVEAYRALVRSARPEQITRYFHEVLQSPVMTRTMLAAEFRPHAEYLCANTLPYIFESGDEPKIVAALEMIESWQRVLSLPALSRLFQHANPEIRSHALRVAPLAEIRAALLPGIHTALEDPQMPVRSAALASAAKMRLHSALPAVQRAVHCGDDTVSRRACLVLASFGPEGHAALDHILLAGDRRIAAWAAEALGRARMGQRLAEEIESYA
jgi:hypothetical protein